MSEKPYEIATFGGGCFWCTEAIFQEVEGVQRVISGYSGGKAPGTPTYKEVCSGLTGHAEVVRLHFAPGIISYKDLLLIFMTTHDPTTLNRQGADTGTQYRSVIFYHDSAQKETALEVCSELKPYFSSGITTEIREAVTFYKAEDSHQDYYRNNGSQGYCSYVIAPKLAKFRKLYKEKLKPQPGAGKHN